MTIKGVFTGDRQTSVEAIDIAAAGKVKTNYVVRGLSELDGYVLIFLRELCLPYRLTDLLYFSIYTELEQGKVAGRIVLDISK